MEQVVDQGQARAETDPACRLFALEVVEQAGVEAHAGDDGEEALDGPAVLQEQADVVGLGGGLPAFAGASAGAAGSADTR